MEPDEAEEIISKREAQKAAEKADRVPEPVEPDEDELPDMPEAPRLLKMKCPGCGEVAEALEGSVIDDHEGHGVWEPLVDEEPGAFETIAQLPVTDDRTQRLFDRDNLIMQIREVRKMLAAAKGNLILANAGLLAKDHNLHPAKFNEAIKDHRKATHLLAAEYERIMEGQYDEDEWRPIGESSLEVARELPKG